MDDIKHSHIEQLHKIVKRHQASVNIKPYSEQEFSDIIFDLLPKVKRNKVVYPKVIK